MQEHSRFHRRKKASSRFRAGLHEATHLLRYDIRCELRPGSRRDGPPAACFVRSNLAGPRPCGSRIKLPRTQLASEVIRARHQEDEWRARGSLISLLANIVGRESRMRESTPTRQFRKSCSFVCNFGCSRRQCDTRIRQRVQTEIAGKPASACCLDRRATV